MFRGISGNSLAIVRSSSPSQGKRRTLPNSVRVSHTGLPKGHNVMHTFSTQIRLDLVASQTKQEVNGDCDPDQANQYQSTFESLQPHTNTMSDV
jgi:hypothetical protein